mmetsp:Transcript_42225/g.64732  ORF Transcript_42225/g.64732 Transcript_42225/m.64732 type:complete len:80 (+) Transcript_42225:731-970(+)
MSLPEEHIKSLAKTRLMHQTQFRSLFGLIGQGSNPFFSDRLFKLADQDRDQHISFEEFASMMDIFYHGTQEEKNELSFA